jgi:hypothetical protein
MGILGWNHGIKMVRSGYFPLQQTYPKRGVVLVKKGKIRRHLKLN